MLGVWVNFAGVVAGGLLGTLLRGGIPQKYQTALNQVLALCVLVIGVSGAIKTSNVLIVIVSAVVGTFMAVVGSLEAGLRNNPDTLLAKSVIDAVSAVIFASTFGIGVVFSAIPLTIYQGGIAALSGVLAPFLTDALVNEMSAVGSLLIIGLSFNMLGVTKERLRVGNMLPAMLVPCAYFPIAEWLGRLF